MVRSEMFICRDCAGVSLLVTPVQQCQWHHQWHHCTSLAQGAHTEAITLNPLKFNHTHLFTWHDGEGSMNDSWVWGVNHGARWATASEVVI